MAKSVANLANISSTICRSSYLSHLRRAFLLRAHPDRFRSHPNSSQLRKVQAEAIQAFQDRISAPDFVAYKTSSNPNSGHHHHHHHGGEPQRLSHQWNNKQPEFHLEKKDGSIQKFTLKLNGGVDEVLHCIVDALKVTGMSVKPPPEAPLAEDDLQQRPTAIGTYFAAMGGNNQANRFGSSFEKVIQRGRNLVEFLKSIDDEEIEKKQASRIDASAAALVARQAYKFQAIDGTGLGWSSASLAKCLISLTKLYDEHNEKFQVKSFYPFRLVLSNDEFQAKVDLYGGTVMLNPGSTQIQWLDILVSVTEDSVEQLEKNRAIQHKNLVHVQNALNITVKKGYSCLSLEYYNFLANLSEFVTVHQNDEGSTALTPERITVVVETAQANRRAKLTNVGQIRVSTDMSVKSITSSIRDLRQSAREKIELEASKNKRAKELMALVQYDLGVTKVFRARFSTINTDQYIESLTALLNLEEETKSEIREHLAGKNLGITGRGRACHVMDDGSIVVPYDWR